MERKGEPRLPDSLPRSWWFWGKLLPHFEMMKIQLSSNEETYFLKVLWNSYFKCMRDVYKFNSHYLSIWFLMILLMMNIAVE